jgi:hypothetical protein
MKQTAYGQPLFIEQKEGAKTVVALSKIEPDNEMMIQDLVFTHPEILPISEVEESYNPLIPVCMELNTPVGPLDVFMVSPEGELCIIETKLWRNPESRRKVVAQILDYAKELANWNYEDLQREVNRRLNRKGNSLFEIAKGQYPDQTLPEADFVDAVSRNLSHGKFLLLIVGDGIREGTAAIRDFISSSGNLMFTLSMVELSLYKMAEAGILVVPKILLKTVEISRLVVELPKGMQLVPSDDPQQDESSKKISPAAAKEKEFYVAFWKEFISDLELDDPGQPLPDPANAQNLFLYPAPTTKQIWISAYFAKSMKRVGVYVRTRNNQEGHEITRYLKDYQEKIEAELGPEALFQWEDNYIVSVRFPCDDIFAPSNRTQIKAFFQEWLNQFVNTFRPLLKRMGEG